MANRSTCNLPTHQCICNKRHPITITNVNSTSSMYNCPMCNLSYNHCTCWTKNTIMNAYTGNPTFFSCKGRIIHTMPGYSGPDLIAFTEVTCSCCKEIKHITLIAISYGYFKSHYHICFSCYIKSLNKQFGIETSLDLEETLYK